MLSKDDVLSFFFWQKTQKYLKDFLYDCAKNGKYFGDKLVLDKKEGKCYNIS